MCFLCFLRPVPWPRKLITCTTRLLAREVEVLNVDDVLAIAIHAIQQDCPEGHTIGILDRDLCVCPQVDDVHSVEEVRRRDPGPGEVEKILATTGVGIETVDHIDAEATLPKQEDVVSGTTVHGVVAGTAVQRVVALIAVQRVIAGTAVQCVVAGGAAQRVDTATAGDDVGETVAVAGEGTVADVRQVLDIGAKRIGGKGRLHRVRAGVCPFSHDVGSRVDNVDVVARSANHRIVACTPVQRVVADTAV